MAHSLPKLDCGKSSSEVNYTYFGWTCPRWFEFSEVATTAKRGGSHPCPYLSPLACIYSIIPTDDCELSQLTTLEKNEPRSEKMRKNWLFFVTLASQTWLYKFSELSWAAAVDGERTTHPVKGTSAPFNSTRTFRTAQLSSNFFPRLAILLV